MTATAQIALALASIIALLGVMGVVKRLARSFDLGAEMQRKLVHICTGLYALTLPWLFPDRWPIYMLLALTLGVMLCLRIPRIANAGIGSTLHGVERQSYGDIFLALAVGLCLFFAEDQLYLYVLPIAVLTLADAAAAPACNHLPHADDALRADQYHPTGAHGGRVRHLGRSGQLARL